MPRPAGETFSLAAGLIKCSLFTIVRDESGILNCAAIAKREGRAIFLCVSKLGRCIPSRLTDEAAPLQLWLRIGPSKDIPATAFARSRLKPDPTTAAATAGYNVEERDYMRMRRMMRGMAGLVVAMVMCAVAAPQAKAPKDPELIDAAGYQKILAEHKGQPLVVTFWATWCEPCRAEYPMLNELAKQYAPQGLKVVGVNLDDDGDIILTRRFMARYKPVFPNYRKKAGGEKEFVNAVLAGWGGAIPASFFYDRDGRQIGKLLGESNRDTYEAAIRTVLSSGVAGN